MTLTTDMLRAWFKQFNADYFGDTLPMPRIALSRARTRLGTMACRRILSLTGWRHTDFTIRISTFYDCTEREYKETLLHEMIHYHIVYNNLRDTSAHGRVFHKLMNHLNSKYGWHITVSSTMRGRQPVNRQTHTQRQTFLVIAIVLVNGERMLSVVNPRSARKIDMLALLTRRITSHRWYMTQDPYFCEFPKVRSLRARRVSTDIYDEKTAAMQPLTLKQIESPNV